MAESKVERAMVNVTLVSVITLIISFLKESIFAYYFGASYITDAYVAAVQLPTVIFSLVSTAISNVVLPFYSKKYNRCGKAEAEAYAANMITAVSIFSLAIVVLIEIFANPIITIIYPGMTTEALELTIILFRLVLPTVVLTQLTNINTAIMNVHKWFVLPTALSGFLNGATIAIMACFSKSLGIYSAILGVFLGTLLEFVVSIIGRRRFVKYRITLNLRDRDLIQSCKNSIPIFVGISAAEINKIVDQIMASMLPAGTISVLSYASKLTTAVARIFISAIATVVYPEFAEKHALSDGKGLAESLQKAIKLIMIIITPIIIGGCLLSRELIAIVYCRGMFDISAVEQTAPVFVCYLICLLFTALRQILSRFFYGCGNTVTPMKNSIIGIVINIVLNIVLSKLLGAIGLALATTISTGIISILLLNDVKKENSLIEYKTVALTTLKVLVASIIMGVVVCATLFMFKTVGFYDISSFLKNCAVCFSSVCIGSIVYLCLLWLFKVNEIKEFVRK